MAEYTYLIGSVIGIVIWIALYYHRKDVRKEMWIMSLLLAFFGLIFQVYFWTKDWWMPANITGTLVGIEDILFGFFMGGGQQ